MDPPLPPPGDYQHRPIAPRSQDKPHTHLDSLSVLAPSPAALCYQRPNSCVWTRVRSGAHGVGVPRSDVALPHGHASLTTKTLILVTISSTSTMALGSTAAPRF